MVDMPLGLKIRHIINRMDSRLIGRLFILCIICLLLYILYSNVGKSNFSKESEKYYDSDKAKAENSPEEFGLKNNVPQEHGKNLPKKTIQNTEPTKVKNDEIEKKELPPKDKELKEINVIITFTNWADNYGFQEKFRFMVSSLMAHTSVPLAIHVIGDEKSQRKAEQIIKESYQTGRPDYRIIHLDVNQLAKQLDAIVRPMQAHFGHKPGAYYSHALFFLSIAIHRVMPSTMHRVIMLDADLKFRSDIKALYKHFDSFTKDNIMGIAHELQPVYRHTFWQYRQKHPGTRVGNPPPDGLTGFNSGVLLMDFDKMRHSKLYNSILNAESIKALTEEFMFKGNLGDQDFFTVLSMKHEELFYVLPCQWNRQLCIWWKDKGYSDVFDQYFKCEGNIHVYHGNCNTSIPKY